MSVESYFNNRPAFEGAVVCRGCAWRVAKQSPHKPTRRKDDLPPEWDGCEVILQELESRVRQVQRRGFIYEFQHYRQTKEPKIKITIDV